MTSPSNCLTTILSNTSVVPLEGYFRTAERTNSDDNLNIGHKDPYVRNPKFFSERERGSQPRCITNQFADNFTAKSPINPQ